MPLVALVLSVAILLLVGLHPTQLLFHTAWEKMTAQNPPATNGDFGREQGMPESTRPIQDEFYPRGANKAKESRVLGWDASFSELQHIGLGMG